MPQLLIKLVIKLIELTPHMAFILVLLIILFDYLKSDHKNLKEYEKQMKEEYTTKLN